MTERVSTESVTKTAETQLDVDAISSAKNEKIKDIVQETERVNVPDESAVSLPKAADSLINRREAAVSPDAVLSPPSLVDTPTDSPSVDTLPRVGPPSPGMNAPASPDVHFMPHVGPESPSGPLVCEPPSPSSTMASTSPRGGSNRCASPTASDAGHSPARSSSPPRRGRGRPPRRGKQQQRAGHPRAKTRSESSRSSDDGGKSSRRSASPSQQQQQQREDRSQAAAERRTSRRHHEPKRVWSPEPDTPRPKRQAAARAHAPPAKRAKHQ